MTAPTSAAVPVAAPAAWRQEASGTSLNRTMSGSVASPREPLSAKR